MTISHQKNGIASSQEKGGKMGSRDSNDPRVNPDYTSTPVPDSDLHCGSPALCLSLVCALCVRCECSALGSDPLVALEAEGSASLWKLRKTDHLHTSLCPSF